jgi:hypothetical protein
MGERQIRTDLGICNLMLLQEVLAHLHVSSCGLDVLRHFLHALYHHDLSIFSTFTMISHSLFNKECNRSKQLRTCMINLSIKKVSRVV